MTADPRTLVPAATAANCAMNAASRCVLQRRLRVAAAGLLINRALGWLCEQGEAKNFSRHVCKDAKVAKRLGLTRQPRQARRPRVRARVPTATRAQRSDSSDSGSVGSGHSVATFSSDSEDGGSVSGGGSGGVGSLPHVGGSTGGSGMKPIHEHDPLSDLEVEPDIDLSLLNGFVDGIPSPTAPGDKKPWDVPGHGEFGGLALWDEGVGSAAADLLMDASGSEGIGSPMVIGAADALDMELDAEFLDLVVGPDAGAEACSPTIVQPPSGTLAVGVPATAPDTTVIVTPTSVIGDPCLVDDDAAVQAELDAAMLASLANTDPVPPAPSKDSSASMPSECGRRVRARLAPTSKVALPVAPSASTGAAVVALAAVAATSAQSSPTMSTVVDFKSQPSMTNRRPAMPVGLNRPASGAGAGAGAGSGGGRGNVVMPMDIKPSGFDWIRGRVSVFMGMFFLFYAVTFVMQEAMVGIDGISPQSAATPPGDPAAPAQFNGATLPEYAPEMAGAVEETDMLRKRTVPHASPAPPSSAPTDAAADAAESVDEADALQFGGGASGGAALDGAAVAAEAVATAAAPPAQPQPRAPTSGPMIADSAADAAPVATAAERLPVTKSAAGGAAGRGPTSEPQAAMAAEASAPSSAIGVAAALLISAVAALALTAFSVVVYRHRVALFRRCRRPSPAAPSYGRLPMVRAL